MSCGCRRLSCSDATRPTSPSRSSRTRSPRSPARGLVVRAFGRNPTWDCADPRTVAEFWCAALGFELADIDEEGAEIKDPSGARPPILFIVVPEGKSVKNRLHLDLRPETSMAAEVDRVKELGATEYRFVEEGGSFWTVIQDPEGNEFCVLRGPRDGWSGAGGD